MSFAKFQPNRRKLKKKYFFVSEFPNLFNSCLVTISDNCFEHEVYIITTAIANLHNVVLFVKKSFSLNSKRTSKLVLLGSWDTPVPYIETKSVKQI